MKLLYLVHDLNDPGAHKRVAMLRDGGAQVIVYGFYRGDSAPGQISGAPTVALGQTQNRKLIARVIQVAKTICKLGQYRTDFLATDVIIARNLEMLALAVRGQAMATSKKPAIVYEVLDIHGLMLRTDLIGKMMRCLEGWLARRASLLVTSSPSFVENYFTPLSKVRLPVRLIENKVYDPAGKLPPAPPARPIGPPWVIGWFGAIRCAKSLRILKELVETSNGQVEVIIRGRPDYSLFENFDRDVANTPGLSFQGPYKYPDDLADIYGQVHFTWAIDYYEEGQNSSWLLPNRLYEGGAMGSVPMALSHVATGHALAQHRIGVHLEEPLLSSLQRFFMTLTATVYNDLAAAGHNVPRQNWIMQPSEIQDIVSQLSTLKAPS